MLQHKTISSPIGNLTIIASEIGLRSILFLGEKHNSPTSETNTYINITIKELEEYFQGTRTNFTVPLDPVGTEFQKKAWQFLSTIPYGKTCSYLDEARALGNTKAVRAVGGANGRNPIPIIVPCHRVIASNNKLQGYAGGLDIKAKLLKLEGHENF